ncbi:unnamed protein product [Calypogeia fissa]
MARTRRRKKRTHVPQQPEGEGGASGEKVPKSFVFARGKLPLLLRQLQHDLRQVMLPHTALRLKETTRNSIKDFVHVAGPLGVSHFLIISHTKNAAYLKVARTPHGPTLTFKIHNYSLAADIHRAQIRPRAPSSIYKSPPLVVLNGFGAAEEQLKLIQIMFQNMFPVINVHTVKLATCQRILLLNYDKNTKCIDFRHYSISAQPVGASRNIRKLVQRKALPDLSGLGDVSEFVTKSGYGSESEVEDETSKVELADEYGKGNHAAHQSSVKLHEVGPRMTLQLVKVEEGLCSGGVMFHEYVKKTPEEIAQLRALVEKREALRKQRKAEQEANVKKKELEKKSRKKKKPEEGQPAEVAGSDSDKEAVNAYDEEDDDAEYYREEVGEEPDEAFKSGARRWNSNRPTGMSKKYFGGRKKAGEGSNSTKEKRSRNSDGDRKFSDKSRKRSHGGDHGSKSKKSKRSG